MAGTVQCLSPSQCIFSPHLAMPGMWLMLGSDKVVGRSKSTHAGLACQICICVSSLNLPALGRLRALRVPHRATKT